MNNIMMAVIVIFGLGLMSLTIGVVVLVRKQFFLYGKNGGFIGKVSGKKARSHGISSVLMGLFFIGLSIAIYLWGG
jgi:hypothetical protein